MTSLRPLGLAAATNRRVRYGIRFLSDIGCRVSCDSNAYLPAGIRAVLPLHHTPTPHPPDLFELPAGAIRGVRYGILSTASRSCAAIGGRWRGVREGAAQVSGHGLDGGDLAGDVRAALALLGLETGDGGV